MAGNMIAAIRLRGTRGINVHIVSTLNMLNLYKKHYCALVKNTPNNMGMLKKVKDFVTWGNVTDEIAKELISKRSEKDPKDAKKIKKFFRLQPPKGGFRKRGIKVAYTQGGDLGDRGEKINDLLKRMI